MRALTKIGCQIHITVLIFIGIMNIDCNAQTSITLNDQAFVNALKTQYPQTIDSNNKLIVSEAKKISGTVNLRNLGLTDINGIQYFTSINQLVVSNNNLRTLPDLSALTLLHTLLCDSNTLSEVPSLSSLTLLSTLSLASNVLTKAPNINSLNSLTAFNLKQNQLTYTALTPISQHPNYNSFQVFPQDTIPLNKEIKLYLNKPLVISTSIDSGMPDLIYLWYKNGVYVDATSIDEYIINNPQPSDTGLYSCVISNTKSGHPFFAKHLFTKDIKVRLGCTSILNINYTIEQSDCKLGTNIKIDETFKKNINESFTYTLKNRISKEEIVSTSPKIDHLFIGNYDLNIVYGEGNCSSTISNAIEISKNTECESSTFSPDGDGLNDSFFIEETGIAEIFNRQGTLVKKLTIPTYWDGRDQNGKILDLGYYVIVINGNSKKYITLLY